MVQKADVNFILVSRLNSLFSWRSFTLQPYNLIPFWYVNYVIDKYNFVTFHQEIIQTFTVDYKVPYGKKGQ